MTTLPNGIEIGSRVVAILISPEKAGQLNDKRYVFIENTNMPEWYWVHVSVKEYPQTMFMTEAELLALVVSLLVNKFELYFTNELNHILDKIIVEKNLCGQEFLGFILDTLEGYTQ